MKKNNILIAIYGLFILTVVFIYFDERTYRMAVMLGILSLLVKDNKIKE